MAIWQFKIYLLPEEEYDSFFAGKHQIDENAFDKTKWWKYRKIEEIKEEFSYLPLTKSWSENITQFGLNNSDCVKLFQDDNYFEISVQFDLRNLNEKFVDDIIEWAERERFIFLDYNYKLIIPTKEYLLKSIENSHEIKWLNKLNKND